MLEGRRERARGAARLLLRKQCNASADDQVDDSKEADRDEALAVPEKHDDEDRRGERAQGEEEERGDAQQHEPRDADALALEFVREELYTAVKDRGEGRPEAPQRSEEPAAARLGRTGAR